MRSYIQILSTPSADSPGTTLLLHFDNKRYLVGNVSEGLQRVCIQRGLKSTKVTEIFLTGKTDWAHTGGLIGMILTLADATNSSAVNLAEKYNEKSKKRRLGGEVSVQKAECEGKKGGVLETQDHAGNGVPAKRNILTIHGGQNLTHTLATARRFVFRKGMPISVDEYDAGQEKGNYREPTWSDENIRVWAMPILPSSITNSRKSNFVSLVNHDSLGSPSEASLHASVREQKDKEDQIRKAVVSEMFDSDWKFDTLIETPLSKVTTPAVLFVRNPETRRIEKYTGPRIESHNASEVPDITVMIRKPWPGAMIESLPPTSPSTQAMSYIIRNHPQRGRFVPEKADKLGVPREKRAHLAKGISVQASDGTIITPDMVLTEGKEGGGFGVVEIPSMDYIHNSVSRPEWKAIDVMDGVGAIIWILGPGVGQNQELKSFMEEMSHLKHIVSSTDYCTNQLTFDSAARAAIKLNQITHSHFPVPVHDNITLPQSRQASIDMPAQPFGLRIPATRGQIVQLEPTVEVQDYALVPPLNTAAVLKETSQDVLRLAQEAKDYLADATNLKELEERQDDIPGRDAEIITLGTGSASPSKYRNVSATLLRVPGSGSYLLDCGENTLGQLKRVFPPEEFRAVLRDLKMIWISHLHADHHLGTASVIRAWYEEVHGGISNDPPKDPLSILQSEKRLFVVAEVAMIRWLEEYASVEDFGYNKLVPVQICSAIPSKKIGSSLRWGHQSGNISLGFKLPNQDINRAMRAATGLSDIQAVNVTHCQGASAVSLSFPTGFKFSYSGDCRPSKLFAEIGEGSTVLLHEATFDDELQGDAYAKKHSTTSEALAVGLAMGARRVLLTHFSQRYQKIPIMEGMEGQDVALEVEEERDAEEDGADTTMVDAATQGFSESSVQRPQHQRGEAVVKIKKPDSVKDVKVGVAFDYMRVKVGEIAHLEKFTPALLKLYEEPEVEDKALEEAGKNGNAKQAKKEKDRQKECRTVEAVGKSENATQPKQQKMKQMEKQKKNEEVKGKRRN
ncbi:MAG: hypothetical protein M1827_006103 [Pycnora praestabilis]|nr:MAG: hypothetical protein M1827_006103 [Pycnora praestabilis]